MTNFILIRIIFEIGLLKTTLKIIAVVFPQDCTHTGHCTMHIKIIPTGLYPLDYRNAQTGIHPLDYWIAQTGLYIPTGLMDCEIIPTGLLNYIYPVDCWIIPTWLLDCTHTGLYPVDCWIIPTWLLDCTHTELYPLDCCFATIRICIDGISPTLNDIVDVIFDI